MPSAAAISASRSRASTGMRTFASSLMASSPNEGTGTYPRPLEPCIRHAGRRPRASASGAVLGPAQARPDEVADDLAAGGGTGAEPDRRGVALRRHVVVVAVEPPPRQAHELGEGVQ